MIPAIALPPLHVTAPPAVPLPASVSEAAIGRLPLSSIAATIALPEIYNNRQGQAQGRSTAVTLPSVSDFLPSLNEESAPEVKATASGPSSSFLAQLFSQSSDADTPGLVSFFTGPNRPNILNYDIFLEFSRVKYKPSNAALPEPEPVAPLTVAEVMAKEQLPLLNLNAALPVKEPSADLPQGEDISGNEAISLPPARVEAPSLHAHSDRSVSLISTHGPDAYTAAFLRTAANLNQRPVIATAAA